MPKTLKKQLAEANAKIAKLESKSSKKMTTLKTRKTDKNGKKNCKYMCRCGKGYPTSEGAKYHQERNWCKG